MNLTVFQADKGDCLLITGDDGKRILVDGGMAPAYTSHVAPALAALEAAKEGIDLVYVSHIDDDHIAGVVRMFDDLAAWTVFDHHVKNGHPSPKAPGKQHPRPPKPKHIWHNAFRETVDDNEGEIEDMLAATATILAGAPADLKAADGRPLLTVADEHRDLATGAASAIRLSRRLRAGQLGVPLNKHFDGKLAYLRKTDMPPPLKLGGMKVTVLGPREADLKKLRTEWDAWLKKNKATLQDIQRKAKAFEEELSSGDHRRVLQPMLAQAKELGNRKDVTAPNLASLMLLVEEDGKTVLLTGDGHADDILAGLRDQGILGKQPGDTLHVDVLKVQHHGAEHNWTDAFARTVIADHYVFCGNGAHDNPEDVVVRSLAKSRLGTAAERSPHPQVGRRFDLWFNFNSAIDEGSAKPDQMEAIEKLVKSLATKSAGKLRPHFLADHSFRIKL